MDDLSEQEPAGGAIRNRAGPRGSGLVWPGRARPRQSQAGLDGADHGLREAVLQVEDVDRRPKSLARRRLLVLIVGIFDLLTAGTTAVADPPWEGFGNEVYLLLAVIYVAFCLAMSRYSQGLERELNRARRH